MVAVLRDAAGRVLITQRPIGKTQAGRWEFPGGKLEQNESPEAGLRRELLEELGIVAGPMRRFIEIRHEYADFSVRLDVREVAHFGGAPTGREGQALKWIHPEALPGEDILEADRPLVQALRLPDYCLVTPDAATMPRSQFLEHLENALSDGIALVQLRAPSLSRENFIELAHDALPVCRARGSRLLLNGPPELLTVIDADGVHLNGHHLSITRRRPMSARWVSAACHTAGQLAHARAIGVDFVFISPVAATDTHPQERPLGWTGFARLARDAGMPAYALGGMTRAELEAARNAGGRGIAAIRGLWGGPVPG